MKHVSRIRVLLCAVAIGASTIGAGCATMPLKTEASTSGIRAAEEVGAAEVPKASLHLQMAKEELEQAKKLSSQGEREKAVSMLMRAEADAELAVALSRESAEKSDAREAIERVRKLLKDNMLPSDEEGYEGDRSNP